jgi:hypothetical protein
LFLFNAILLNACMEIIIMDDVLKAALMKCKQTLLFCFQLAITVLAVIKMGLV